MESGDLASWLLRSAFGLVHQGSGARRPVVIGVALCLHWVVLEGGDLGQELLVKQSQLLLLLKDVFAVESYLSHSRSDCTRCSCICSLTS